jgi:DnaK suppressor protein
MKRKTPLTEEQLLASDPGDYMNAAQRAFFRQRLLTMQTELISNARRSADELKEAVVQSDPADRATLEEEYALELLTLEREHRLAAQIEAALKRIDEETYGFCEDTGEPIGLARLVARPTATRSIHAQERREKLQKSYAD